MRRSATTLNGSGQPETRTKIALKRAENMRNNMLDDKRIVEAIMLYGNYGMFIDRKSVV